MASNDLALSEHNKHINSPIRPISVSHYRENYIQPYGCPLNRKEKVKECDARKDENRLAAGLKKINVLNTNFK
jgi:hypothetical protein